MPCLPTQDLDQKFDLKFSDEYIEKMFREADKSYSKGVRYEDLLGGPGQTTAEGEWRARAQSGTGKGRRLSGAWQ